MTSGTQRGTTDPIDSRLAALRTLRHSSPPKATPDDWQTAELFGITADNGRLRNKIIEEDMRARKHYARALFILVCSWLGIALAIVILVGWKVLALSDAVLIALITTTTASVIGLFAIVARYFYRQTHHLPSTTEQDASK